MKTSKIASAVSGAFLVISMVITGFPLTANAQSLVATLSMQSGCQSLVNGSISSSLSLVAGSNDNITIANTDLVISQNISGPGISGKLTDQGKGSSGPSSATYQLGVVNAQENIVFTPIPRAANTGAVNFCPNGPALPSTLVINTTPAPATPSTTTVTSTSTPQSQLPTPTTTTTPTAPSSPVFGAALIEGKSVDITKPIEFSANKSFKILGQTVPNATVTLTIHSTPKTVTFKSNSDGSWSYLVTGLAPGSHYIDASVTDPTSKLSSPITKIVSFKIDAVVTAQPAKPKTDYTPYIVGGIIIVILLCILIYAIKKDKKRKTPMQSSQTPVPAPSINAPEVIEPEKPESPQEVIEEKALKVSPPTKRPKAKKIPKKKKVTITEK